MHTAFKTAQLCLAAVQQNGRALQYVPEAFITAELCRAAVQQDAAVLMYVPKGFSTAEICFPKAMREHVKKEAGV